MGAPVRGLIHPRRLPSERGQGCRLSLCRGLNDGRWRSSGMRNGVRIGNNDPDGRCDGR